MLLSPLLAVGVAIFALIGLGGWFFHVFRGVIRFFKGDTFFPEMQEDKDVAIIVKAQHDQLVNLEPEPEPVSEPVAGPTYIQNNYYTKPQEQPLPKDVAPLQNANPQVIEEARFAPLSEPKENPEIQQIPAKEVDDEEDPFHLESSIDHPMELPEGYENDDDDEGGLF